MCLNILDNRVHDVLKCRSPQCVIVDVMQKKVLLEVLYTVYCSFMIMMTNFSVQYKQIHTYWKTKNLLFM